MMKIKNLLLIIIFCAFTKVDAMDHSESSINNSSNVNLNNETDKVDAENSKLDKQKQNKLKESISKYGHLAIDASVLGTSLVFSCILCGEFSKESNKFTAFNVILSTLYPATLILKKWVDKYKNIEIKKKQERLTNFNFLFKNYMTAISLLGICLNYHYIKRSYKMENNEAVVFSGLLFVPYIYSLNDLKNDLLPEYKSKLRNIRDVIAKKIQIN